MRLLVLVPLLLSSCAGAVNMPLPSLWMGAAIMCHTQEQAESVMAIMAGSKPTDRDNGYFINHECVVMQDGAFIKMRVVASLGPYQVWQVADTVGEQTVYAITGGDHAHAPPHDAGRPI